MENYIVRIYRRDCSDPEKVTGMLESVEKETRQPFHSIDALRSLLSAAPAPDLHEPRAPGDPETSKKISATLIR